MQPQAHTALHWSWSDVLIISIDMWDPDTGICAWNNVESCVSKGENTLLVWWVRSGDGNGRANTRCRVHMVLEGPGAVTRAHPGSGLGLSECNRWQKPEGRHPMVLIFRGLGSALWLPVRPACLCTLTPLQRSDTWTFQPGQPITSQQLKYMKLTMTQSIWLGINKRILLQAVWGRTLSFSLHDATRTWW